MPADASGVAELMAGAGIAVSPAELACRLDALRQEPGAALLALEWGPPSGLIVLNWFRTLRNDHPVAQITALLVGSKDRRRGVGRLLLKAGAQAARSAGCVEISLFGGAAKSGLREFGIANGFEETGLCLVRSLRKRS